jgi:xanthine/uracil permease
VPSPPTSPRQPPEPVPATTKTARASGGRGVASPEPAFYGFRHVLTFHAGAVLVPIIIAGAIKLPQEELVKLITADLFTCANPIAAARFNRLNDLQ